MEICDQQVNDAKKQKQISLVEGDVEDYNNGVSREFHQQVDDAKKQKLNSLVDENNDSDGALIHEEETWVLARNCDRNISNVSGTTSSGCSDVNKWLEGSCYSDTLTIGEQQILYNEQFLIVACRDLQPLLPEYNAQ